MTTRTVYRDTRTGRFVGPEQSFRLSDGVRREEVPTRTVYRVGPHLYRVRRDNGGQVRARLLRLRDAEPAHLLPLFAPRCTL